ncbi:MAG: tRNA pseudouridine(55) synthase TruB [Clostridia bacterium]|nr:tRNA pseudouridine(55) synthase TruB [Clostridia bacterium]
MNGFINIHKPAGLSSAAVVGVMKRLTGEKRIGHAGTLDPEAAGVLPIMLGRATRLFDYLVDKEKEYEAVCAFGTATDTQDATGEVTARGEDYPDPARILQEIPKLTGDIRQKPSMFSAIKVGGRHLYDLARRGESAEVPERTVHVERIEILGEEPEHAVRLRIACGKGTYIRSICDDLGKFCGCPAHMRSLIRTRSGFFTLDGALTLEEARELAEEGKLGQRLIPMDAPIQHLRRMDAPTGLARMVAAGAKLPLDRMSGEEPEENGVTRIYLENAFWGMAERRGDQLVWRAQIPPDSE